KRPVIDPHYDPLWDHLNGFVHPSKELRYRMVDESALLATDSFDEKWATESIEVASEVFDLAWLVVLSRFPKYVPLLTVTNTFRYCPRTRALVGSSVGSGLNRGARVQSGRTCRATGCGRRFKWWRRVRCGS